MKEIFSKQNKLIKDLKKQKRQNRFLLFLDNPKSIADAVSYGKTPKLLLVDREKLANLPSINAQQTIITNSEVIAELSSTITPQGMVAVFDWLPQNPKKPQGNFLVLDGLQDAGNIGTLLRSALGANFGTVFLLDCVALTNEKIVRSSMSAILRLHTYEMSREDFCAFAKEHNLPLALCDMVGQDIFQMQATTPTGVVVGSEGQGITSQLRALSKTSFKIPMENNLESLNAGVAGSIIMFKINNQKR